MRGTRYVVGGAALAAMLGLGVLWAQGWPWACPSRSELERSRSLDEVRAAFAEQGAELVPAALPAGGWRRVQAYRRATVLRYSTERASVYVLVCRRKCAIVPVEPRALPVAVPAGGLHRIRQISGLGNNLLVFFTDNDRRSTRRLQTRVQPALNDLDAAVAYGSRCYIE